MLYNSFSFLLFFPAVVVGYYLLPHRTRWVYLLVVSYLFYANWNLMHVFLLAGITLFTWLAGWVLWRYPRKWLLALVVCASFSGLFAFKYLNFVTDSLCSALDVLGWHIKVSHPNGFDWLLPIGISFYTFMAVGYVIEVYRKTIRPERNLARYALFVSFFPQIAAGPIGRAGQLMPQFVEERRLDTGQVTAGLRMMLWGYFMKVVVADRLSLYTEAVFGNIAHHTGLSVMVAALFFSIQIYCDFAGYSFLAWGTAKAMGFDLIMNFERPYMACSVSDFWRRWHISLSTWFRDYVYFPLGGSRCGKWRTRLNLMVTFLVSGLWHGANWTFVVWGGLNGLFQVVGKWMPSIKTRQGIAGSETCHRVFRVVRTFLLMTVAWTFFKARTLEDACLAIRKMTCPSGRLYVPQMSTVVYCIMGVLLVVLADVLWERNGRHPWLEHRNVSVRFSAYVLLAMMILAFGVFDGGQFIYFQF